MKQKYTKEIEDNLRCPIHMGIFDDPRSLGCGHVFCKHCINDIALNNSKIKCPLCRSEWQIPNNFFPIAYNLSKIIEIHQDHKEAVNNEESTRPVPSAPLLDSFHNASTSSSPVQIQVNQTSKVFNINIGCNESIRDSYIVLIYALITFISFLILIVALTTTK